MKTLQKTKQTSLLEQDIFTQIMLNQFKPKTDIQSIHNGYGACWECKCQEYVHSYGDICYNCGHHFNSHS